VKRQSADFLEKARVLLENATTMLSVDLTAQALIFESQDRVFKTHTGVQSEFARLVKDDPRIDSELRAFLGLT